MGGGGTDEGEANNAVFDGRYRVQGMLGRGGMATVYAVVDNQSGQHRALKALRNTGDEHRDRRCQQLFEREYHTLVQLAHPHIVRVYDYGLSDAVPYYTMEVLGGGDLKDRATTASWQAACRMARDVCSALSLMHSRRLVYRDLGPRNVRWTEDGHAKLIDFGALVEMGGPQPAVCTPPVAAPEVVRLQPLDGRADLYALGATLYYLLAGQHAYPARRFAQLGALWEQPVVPLSERTPGIPESLDRLVMDLLQLDPRLRPASAAEVSQRLSAIAGLPEDADLASSNAYLMTPVLVGRERPLARFRTRLHRLVEGGTGSAVLVRGQPGSGRTRFLDACSLDANLAGVTVLRVGAGDATPGPLGAIRSLAAEWVKAAPEAALASADQAWHALATLVPELGEANPDRPVVTPDLDSLRGQSHRLLRTWLAAAASDRRVMWVFDGLDRIDPESRALATLLANDSPQAGMLVLASCAEDSVDETIQLFEERCRTLTLQALDRSQTRTLLASVFGDVPNLASLVERLFSVSHGNPQAMLRVAQHLVDQQLVRYEGGVWSLPERVDDRVLPGDMSGAMRVVAGGLTPAALKLAQTLSLFPDQSFSFAECVAMSGRTPRARVFAHLEELASAFIVERVGEDYQLAGADWAGPLLEGLADAERSQLQESLSTVFDIRGDGLRTAQCLLAAGGQDEALDALIAHAVESSALTDRDPDAFVALLMNAPKDWPQTYLEAIELCRARGRCERDLYALRNRMTGMASPTHVHMGAHYVKLAERLAQDAGLDAYEALDQSLPQGERLRRALETAGARYGQASDHDRLFDPQQSVALLVRLYVAACGNMGNTLDVDSWNRMPSIEPLAPLSPAVAIITRMGMGFDARLKGRLSQAIGIYDDALRLVEENQSSMERTYSMALQSGLAAARCILAAGLGLPISEAQLALVQASELHEATVLLIRGIERLWQGDTRAADALARERELRRLEHPHPDAFQTLAQLWNLQAHAAADDLTRVRQDVDSIRAIAAHTPTWAPVLAWAEGEYERIRGDQGRALAAFDRALGGIGAGQHMLWVPASASRTQVLLAMGQEQDAHAHAQRALAMAIDAGLGADADPLRLALAQAAATCGHTAEATALVDEVLTGLGERGVTGLHLGLAHEFAARVYALIGDRAAFESHGTRCQELYHRHDNRALATRGERMWRESRRLLGDLGVISEQGAEPADSSPATAMESVLATCQSSEDRLDRSLLVLLERTRATRAALFTWESDSAVLCAKRGQIPNLAGLQEAVTHFMEAARGSDETRTANGEEEAAAASEHIVEHHGQRYALVLLSHGSDRGLAISGAVALCVEPGVDPAAADEVTAAVSRVLSASGDLTTQLAWL